MPDKYNLFGRAFWAAAATRALRTLAQTAVALIGTAAVLDEVQWPIVASGALLAGLLSVLSAIGTGLPEVED